MRYGRSLALAAGLALLSTPAAAQSYKPEFKTSVVTAAYTSWGQAAARFADIVRQRTRGRINIKTYYSGHLLSRKQNEEFAYLSRGAADFAFGSTINWSPQVKELNLFSLPFFFPSYRALDAVEQGEPGRRLFRIIESKGVVPLAWGENGFREITNNQRAVRRPEDLEGLKIRVVDSPIFVETLRALGANPVDMNFAEALQAFFQGTVDGQENPIVNVIIPYKLWAFQKHITLWQYTIDPIIVAVSRATWDTLTPSDQEVVRNAAVEVAAWQKAEARKGLDGSTAAVERLRREGMNVVTLTAAETDAFRARTRAVYDRWVGEIGPDLVKSAEEIIARTW